MGDMAFGFAHGRQVEGGHALVNVQSSGKRNRTEAFDSLTLRLPEIEELLASDTSFLPQLLDALEQGRSPAKALSMLSLRGHPSAALAQGNWDPIYRKIVYHADPIAMYRIRRVLPARPGPPGPPAAPAPDHGAPEIYKFMKHHCNCFDSIPYVRMKNLYIENFRTYL